MGTFTIGSLVLPETSAGGEGFWFTGLKDWDSLAESKTERESRPQAHGDFEEEYDWRESITPTCAGYFSGATVSAARDAKDTVKSIGIGTLQLATFTDDDGHARHREVSIQGVSIPDSHSKNEFEFTIDMLAADPFAYGDPATVSTGLPTSGTGYVWPAVWPSDWGSSGVPGSLVTVNGGSQDTTSLFQVTGGLSGGFSLISVEDAREIRFERPIPLGSTVFVDPTSGRAWIDDQANDVSGYLTRSEWWVTPARSFRTVQFNALGDVTGTPTFTAVTSPAYL